MPDLKVYNKKRDFKKTSEPKGQKKKSASGFSYVIQKHAASRLHYDFRLEWKGVLLSWAVPKGPSLDTRERRLAVRVEDHPLDYGGFEGIIPEGEYGGGTVMLWDRGEWTPRDENVDKSLRTGELKFDLHGEKLSGGWMLVKMKGRSEEEGKENWLLIKEKDDAVRPLAKYDVLKKQDRSVTTSRSMEEIAAEAKRGWSGKSGELSKKEIDSVIKKSVPVKKKRATPVVAKQKATKQEPTKQRGLQAGELTRAREARLPATMAPELAMLVKEAPRGDGWLHEIKYDGYRLLCRIADGKIKLLTRNGKDWTRKFPDLAKAAEALPVKSAIFDGELVALDESGVSNFQWLQNHLNRSDGTPLTYFVFDMPYCEGYDLTRTPLTERKALAGEIIGSGANGNGTIRFSEHIEGQGGEVWQKACKLSLEGIISKRADSAYTQKRTRDWVKTKCARSQEFVIGGYSDPGGARKGFGALLLGYYDGPKLIYCGRVGTGFTETTLKDMTKRLKALERKTPAFVNPPRGVDARGAHWVSPELVGELEFTGWTEAGTLRHPSFKGLREDKPAKEVVREKPAEAGAMDSEPKESAAAKPNAPAKNRKKIISATEADKAAPKRPTAKADKVTIAGVALSHPDRVLYPELGLTKRELAEFYEKIGDKLLPHVAGRPLTLVRCPEGSGKECFYQKHVGATSPPGIGGIRIREKQKEDTYIVIHDLRGLISTVQMGALELHPWGAREDNIERPDRLIFDLDPDAGLKWERVVEGAQTMRKLLEGMGLRTFLKTSGGKGLHIVLPIERRTSWDDAKAFCKAVAAAMESAQPDRYVSNMSKAKRKGRIFIDYLRNGRGATSVSAYSTRARKGAPVSTPVSWDELTADLKPDAYTVRNLLKRLTALKKDPWADFFRTKQAITQAMLKSL